MKGYKILLVVEKKYSKHFHCLIYGKKYAIINIFYGFRTIRKAQKPVPYLVWLVGSIISLDICVDVKQCEKINVL